MPRKPTPAILNTPNESPTADDLLGELVEAPKPKRKPRSKPAAAIKAVVEPASEAVEAIPAAVEQLVEALPGAVEPAAEAASQAVEEVAQAAPLRIEEVFIPPSEETGEPERVIAIKLPKPMRTLFLAYLGAASYLVEEAKLIGQKLVERGEITEKEAIQALDKLELDKKFKLPQMGKKEPKGAGEPGGGAEKPEKEPKPEDEETPEEGNEKGRGPANKTTVFSLSLFSGDSPIHIDRNKK